MISTKVNNRKTLFGSNMTQTKKKFPIGYQQENSIKNYMMSKPIEKKNYQSTYIDVEKNKVKENQVNDENCSYNANITQINTFINQDKLKIQIPSFVKIQNQPTSENLDQLNCSEKLSDQTNKVINLKKKIKKCVNSNPSYDFFRQKVTFKKKIYKFTTNNTESDQMQNKEYDIKKQNKIQVQQTTQTFLVYRDSEVFTSLRSKELRNKLVPQRMDNDTQTDDEQVQKFVKRITTDFLQHIQKVKNQNSLNQQDKNSQLSYEEEY